MEIHKNRAYAIDDDTDIIIRATPEDAPTGEQKAFFIVDMNRYDKKRTHYTTSSHCMETSEVRKLLGLKKREVLVII